MIHGFADLQGTEQYAKRFSKAREAGHFRNVNGFFISSIGLGTYLGEMDDYTDRLSYKAAEHCLEGGINVI
ncbi:MAG: aldo/keto reductase, partial [Candidatus Omnitrophica bacterium]|nr:aldo/keto reductase [Candidatus Omnitrophota bacterium]